MIVRWTGKRTRKDNIEIMIRSDPFIPFVHLVIKCALPGKFVWPCPAFPGWFVSSMELYVQMMLRSFLYYLGLDIRHLLVIAIHKINHHSRNTPFFKNSKRRVELRI